MTQIKAVIREKLKAGLLVKLIMKKPGDLHSYKWKIIYNIPRRPNTFFVTTQVKEGSPKDRFCYKYWTPRLSFPSDLQGRGDVNEGWKEKAYKGPECFEGGAHEFCKWGFTCELINSPWVVQWVHC